jgi:hypothetical protein
MKAKEIERIKKEQKAAMEINLNRKLRVWKGRIELDEAERERERTNNSSE